MLKTLNRKNAEKTFVLYKCTYGSFTGSRSPGRRWWPKELCNSVYSIGATWRRSSHIGQPRKFLGYAHLGRSSCTRIRYTKRMDLLLQRSTAQYSSRILKGSLYVEYKTAYIRTSCIALHIKKCSILHTILYRGIIFNCLMGFQKFTLD